ncbi:hypothetical protein GCM10011490_24940 [Pseudoclavibacter endophyticus]|uniref:WXG100 family type VII secretion target n=1 Tax=Pseudoclavibacter endophyticus TaxID=1778590 RepID=A0A6H9WPI6_9MICO|nr:hypothetical protein [Pseudoclavibacter endophyticus]KAB1647825.1 hypothetical protein F8O04_12455 [Pseudoclavibacter endophyticus]GGA73131.1 hypothetical protein GCM10011490_24940 [Pseudoclavibacter endophyticus]
MYGANPGELRMIARRFELRSDLVRGVAATTRREVEATDWIGPDADAFKGDYEAFLVTELRALSIVLQVQANVLARQADEQDAASESDGSSGGFGTWLGGYAVWPQPSGPRLTAPIGRISEPPASFPQPSSFPLQWPPLWQNLLRMLPDLVPPGVGAAGGAFVVESGYAIAQPGLFGPIFAVSWTKITAYAADWAPTGTPAERAVTASPSAIAAPTISTPVASRATEPAAAADRVLSQGGSGWNGGGGSAAEPVAKSIGGSGGLTGLQTLSAPDGGPVAVFAKESTGRDFVGGMTGFNPVPQLGHNDGGFLGTLRAVLGAAAFVPGSVGWAAGGASIGFALYEHIPAFRSWFDGLVHWFGSGIRAINPFD